MQRFTPEAIAGRLCLGIAGIRLAKARSKVARAIPLKPYMFGRATRLAGAPDFMAVVDFDQDSEHYPKVVETVRFPRRSL